MKKIKLTENDFKKIILECVKLVLNESLGAITNHLNQLSEKIFDLIKKGKTEIIISPEEFNEAQSYYITKVPLVINCYNNIFDSRIASQKSDDIADYISINLPLFKEKDAPSSVILHELTHLINRKMTTKPLFAPKVNDERTQRILYLFHSSEMQARLSEFFSTLRNTPREQIFPNIKSYEDILHSQEMKAYINNCIKGDDDYTIKMLFGMNQYNKQQKIDPKAKVNYDFSSFNLEQERQKMIKYYTKKYNEFVNKATNILGLFLQ